MNTPSNDLKAMADAPKADLEAILIEWGSLFKGLRILHGPLIIGESLACKLHFTELIDDDEEMIMELMLMTHPYQVATEEQVNDPVWVHFRTGDRARIDSHTNVHPVLVPFLGFEGTWKEVAKKVFEMEQLMLAQIPEVPDDLKHS